MFNVVSLDGYFAGIDGNIDWHMVDDEFNQYAVKTIAGFDTMLFGRVTYELFESYWPKALEDAQTSSEDMAIARAINDMQKIVFSTTLDKVTWNNSKLSSYITAEEIKKLKAEPGKDIVIYGSGTIVRELTSLGLIDEYRFMVNPVVIGTGKRLFKDMPAFTLKLLDTKTFTSGNVLLTYKPIK